MENGYPVPNNPTDNQTNAETNIIDTTGGQQNGQEKCPKCGSTDIALNPAKGLLRCNFCRFEFPPVKVEGLKTDISSLEGEVITSGAQNIVADTNDVITLKCSSCEAEVVIDTSEASQARCHWCRNTLSINEQIPNGSIPDFVLPFSITKSDAQAEIRKFVSKRNFYANPKFKQEFTTDNIMGVYFPYMLVDINTHADFSGQGEHLVRSHVVSSNNSSTTYYDADLYSVEREFDLTINDLTIESNSDRLNNMQSNKTNNVINAIMPFDTENCVKWNANYLKGYTSERRDTNIEQIKDIVKIQAEDIARFAANETLKDYNRGVAWAKQNVDIKGEQWKTAYLPVWLYSYQEVKGNNKILHYVAVNARTKETMGSVPVYMPMLIGISALIELLAFLIFLFFDSDYSWLFLTAGFIYFFIIYGKYRNAKERHHYELETKTNLANLRANDTFIEHRKNLTNSRINGANNTNINGSTVKENFMDKMLESSGVSAIMNEIDEAKKNSENNNNNNNEGK